MSRYLLPGGIGDILWAFTKIEDVHRRLGKGHIECFIANRGVGDKLEDRALPFLERFPFVYNYGCVKVDLNRHTGRGAYDHVYQGRILYLHDLLPVPKHGIDFVLIPNGHIENGERLEKWLPSFDTDWDIMKRFKFTPVEEERGKKNAEEFGQYCVFYFGPTAGNTTDGHNRGPLWTPQDWLRLAINLRHWDKLNIVLTGAEYDRSYWEDYIKPLFGGIPVIDLIGKTALPDTIQILKRARFVVGYDSGITVIANFMGVPTVSWWRPNGDSLSPHVYFSKDERGISSWVSPQMLADQKHLGLIYTKETADQIALSIAERGW